MQKLRGSLKCAEERSALIVTDAVRKFTRIRSSFQDEKLTIYRAESVVRFTDSLYFQYLTAIENIDTSLYQS